MESIVQYYLNQGYRITSPYGWRIHPITGIRSFHHGTDLGGKPRGYPLRTPYSGIVIGTGFGRVYGNWVAIRSARCQMVYFFGHLTEAAVPVGQTLASGAVIGGLGATGSATGVHLHLEVRKHDGSSNGGTAWGDPQVFEERGYDMARIATPIIIEGKAFKAFYDTEEKITYVEARESLEAVGCRVQFQGTLEKGTIVIPPAPKIVEVIKEVPDLVTLDKVRKAVLAFKDLESI